MNQRNHPRVKAGNGLQFHRLATIFFTLLLGFNILGHLATLNAQDAAHGSNPAQTGSGIQGPSSASSSAPVTDVYLINPGDSLDVYIFDVPELSRTYIVSPSGVVVVPLLAVPFKPPD